MKQKLTKEEVLNIIEGLRFEMAEACCELDDLMTALDKAEVLEYDDIKNLLLSVDLKYSRVGNDDNKLGLFYEGATGVYL